MKQAINGFQNMGINDFNQKLKTIVGKMTGNTYFPTLQTTVQELATTAAAFQLLVDAATGGDEEAVVKRNVARANITEKLHSLGRHVTAVADNSVEILASSGYSYTQDRKPTADLVAPTNLKVGLGASSGEIFCRTTTQPGVKSFNFYITTDPAALTDKDSVSWNIISWNKTKYTFTGLTSGQRYYIRVGLVGVRGQEVISEPVSYIPQ